LTSVSDSAALLGERLIDRDDARWEEARAAWNLAVDQRPAAVVQAQTVADVTAAVDLARERGLRVAPQGTGHGATTIGELENALLLKTFGMSAVSVDAARRTVAAGAGALWVDVAREAGAHGLAALAGTSPDVGVVGYTVGGGLGWLGRRYGLACNSVRSFDVVTADGHALRVDETSQPELFWALRGGGGGYAIVTALELEAYPVEDVYAGAAFWPAERAPELLRAYASWVETVPDEMTSLARLLHLPDLPLVPEPLRDVWLVGVEACHVGPADEAMELLRPLREPEPAGLDTFGVIRAADLHLIHGDPPQPVPGVGHHVVLDELGGDCIDALVVTAGAESGSPLISVEIRHLGGAIGRRPDGAGALATLDGRFALFGLGLPSDPEDGVELSRYLTGFVDGLAPWRARRGFLNFSEQPEETAGFFDAETYERLVRIKREWDPDDLLVANHPVG
jgi:FAD/FMN-containing dehydrogenase